MHGERERARARCMKVGQVHAWCMARKTAVSLIYSLSLAHSLSLTLSCALFCSRALSLLHSISAPAKKWAAPSGYVPGSQTVSRNADAGYTGVSSQSQVMTLATAKKWQPYLGYEPKRDRSTSAPAAPLSSAPSATAQMSSGTLREREIYAERERERGIQRERAMDVERQRVRCMQRERERCIQTDALSISKHSETSMQRERARERDV